MIAIAAIMWLLTSLSKWEIISTLIFIAVIVIIYFITKWFKNKNATVETAANKGLAAVLADE